MTAKSTVQYGNVRQHPSSANNNSTASFDTSIFLGVDYYGNSIVSKLPKGSGSKIKRETAKIRPPGRYANMANNVNNNNDVDSEGEVGDDYNNNTYDSTTTPNNNNNNNNSNDTNSNTTTTNSTIRSPYPTRSRSRRRQLHQQRQLQDDLTIDPLGLIARTQSGGGSSSSAMTAAGAGAGAGSGEISSPAGAGAGSGEICQLQSLSTSTTPMPVAAAAAGGGQQQQQQLHSTVTQRRRRRQQNQQQMMACSLQTLELFSAPVYTGGRRPTSTSYKRKMAEAEADAEQRRIVAKTLHRIPYPPHIIKNNKEGNDLLILLYKLGILSDYNTAFDAADVHFDDYFGIFNYRPWSDIEVHSETGLITFLHLKRYDHNFDDGIFVDNNDGIDEDDLIGPYMPIDVPPIIDQFQSLESIELINCRLLPKELGNLPLLKTIELRCPGSVFENIPDGLQLSSIKEVVINSDSKTTFKSNLSSFLKIFSNTLEELKFDCMTREDSEEILHVLQNDDLCFRHSLTTIRMPFCELNEDDLVILMFNIREKFTNLREIDVGANDIKSLCGIENKIKQVLSSSFLLGSVISIGSNLRKLDLYANPLCYDIRDTKDNSTQISALLTILNNFDRISNLGEDWEVYQYGPDVENVLRINYAGRKLIRNKEIASSIIATATDTPAPVINPALWPLILERAYKKSCYFFRGEEMLDRNMNVTGVFDLVLHYWPRLLKNRYRQTRKKKKLCVR